MKDILIIGNWKMQLSLKEGEVLALKLETAFSGDGEFSGSIVICPSFTHLTRIKDRIKRIKLGAQNVFWEKQGAYTGEVSALFLEEIGCEYVIIGHSERRNILLETDQMVNNKIKAVLEASLIPILCVGESIKDRENGLTRAKIKNQLEAALMGVDNFISLVIAYEPVWAIGSGEVPLAEEIQDVCSFIKKLILEKYGQKNLMRTSVLYGGSVDGKNAGEFIRKDDVNGFLVGGASVQYEEFVRIIKAALNF